MNTNLREEYIEKRNKILDMFKETFGEMRYFEEMYVLKLSTGREVRFNFSAYLMGHSKALEVWVGCYFFVHKDDKEDYNELGKLVREEIIRKLPIKAFIDEDAVLNYFQMEPYRKLDHNGWAKMRFFLNPAHPKGVFENHTL